MRSSFSLFLMQLTVEGLNSDKVLKVSNFVLSSEVVAAGRCYLVLGAEIMNHGRRVVHR